jgi:hypothetical protein
MAYMLAQFQVDDYDSWKRERFDADPAGRKETAKGYMLFRGVDDPNRVWVGVEFASVEEAKAFRERLLASGVLEAAMEVVSPPTVAEVADRVEY